MLVMTDQSNYNIIKFIIKDILPESIDHVMFHESARLLMKKTMSFNKRAWVLTRDYILRRVLVFGSPSYNQIIQSL